MLCRCGRDVPRRVGRGRPRIYCSNRCKRQAEYRRDRTRQPEVNVYFRNGRVLPKDTTQLYNRIKAVTLSSPEMSPTEIAKQLGCSHVTVRRAQRTAGVYVPRGASGQRQS